MASTRYRSPGTRHNAPPKSRAVAAGPHCVAPGGTRMLAQRPSPQLNPPTYSMPGASPSVERPTTPRPAGEESSMGTSGGPHRQLVANAGLDEPVPSAIHLKWSRLSGPPERLREQHRGAQRRRVLVNRASSYSACSSPDASIMFVMSPRLRLLARCRDRLAPILRQNRARALARRK